jgi:predicted amidohydrolase
MQNILVGMSKLINLGMPLQHVTRRATLNPALQIKRPQFGCLSVGSEAYRRVAPAKGRFRIL